MERLSIDEAISNFKLFHKEDLEKLTYEEDFLKRFGYTKERLNTSAERNSQLVEWLEELKSYRDAEEQGLLLRLPCKVGDRVYCWRKIIPTTYSNYVCEKWLQTDDEFIPARVVSIRTTKKGMFIKVALKGKCLVQHRWDGEDITSDDYEYCMVSLPVGCIGKTVFLTKEEAEQKLEEMKGEV